MTVEELNALMPTLFLSSELAEISWSNISTPDKSVLITKAEDYLNDLRYEANVEDIEGYSDAKNKAECCIIFDLLLNQTQGSSRMMLIRQGVKSITTAGVSESYGTYADIQGNESGISDSYKKYLWRYLFNGV